MSEPPRLRPGGLLRRLAEKWSHDNVPLLAAGLAFHTLLALSPLLVVEMALAGLILAPAVVEGRLASGATRLFGPAAARLLLDLMVRIGRSPGGLAASVVGVLLALLAASNVIVQARYALDTLWGVPRAIGTMKSMVVGRAYSVLGVLTMAVLMLAWVVVDAALAVLGGVLERIVPEPLPVWHAAAFLVTLASSATLFAIFYRILPDLRVAWRDIVPGAIVGALLFTLGKAVLGLYFRWSGVVAAYGAAGSLVVILLWFYYSAQSFLLGAEIGVVVSREWGVQSGRGRPRR